MPDVCLCTCGVLGGGGADIASAPTNQRLRHVREWAQVWLLLWVGGRPKQQGRSRDRKGDIAVVWPPATSRLIAYGNRSSGGQISRRTLPKPVREAQMGAAGEAALTSLVVDPLRETGAVMVEVLVPRRGVAAVGAAPYGLPFADVTLVFSEAGFVVREEHLPD